MRNSKRYQIAIMSGLLGAIIIILALYEYYIYSYNNTERSFDDQSDKASCLEITPRGGSTDSWIKRVDNGVFEKQYYGCIYDMTITNYNNDSVSEWSLTIQIPQDCYLNNSWCGEVEIHQFSNGTEAVQTLDLRDYSEPDITIDHWLEGSDLLIPLSAGDYLVYHPSLSADEYPIPECFNDNTSPVVAGLIFYTDNDEAMVFGDFTMEYKLSTKFMRNRVSIVIITLAGLWIILFFIFASVEWSMRRAQKRYQQDERIIHQSIGVFTHFFEAKDIYTNGHSQRVAQYARLLAEKLNMPEDERRNLYYIALMHDCGKCYIPDAVLKKDGKLTAEEYDIIKSHTVKGAEMISDFTAIDHIRDGVLYHHERYDGNGYPEGLKGEAIPYVSRIICVCDSFDAMNSKRCYRDRLSKDKILSELRNCSGKQFDPVLADAFLELISEGKIDI